MRLNSRFFMVLALLNGIIISMEKAETNALSIVKEVESENQLEKDAALARRLLEVENEHSSEEELILSEPSSSAYKEIKFLEDTQRTSLNKTMNALKRKFDNSFNAMSTVIAVQHNQNYKPEPYIIKNTLKDSLEIAQSAFDRASQDYEKHLLLIKESEQHLGCDDTANLAEPLINDLYEIYLDKIHAEVESFFALAATKYVKWYTESRLWDKRAKKAKTYGKDPKNS